MILNCFTIVLTIIAITLPTINSSASNLGAQAMAKMTSKSVSQEENNLIRSEIVMKNAKKLNKEGSTVLVFNTTLVCQNQTERWCARVEMWEYVDEHPQDITRNRLICTKRQSYLSLNTVPMYHAVWNDMRYNSFFTMMPFIVIYHDCTTNHTVQKYVFEMDEISANEKFVVVQNTIKLDNLGDELDPATNRINDTKWTSEKRKKLEQWKFGELPEDTLEIYDVECKHWYLRILLGLL